MVKDGAVDAVEGYKWTATITEDTSGEPQATWGVQFCQRPSLHQIEGCGSCWPGRTGTGGSDAAGEGIAEGGGGGGRWRDIFATCNGAFVRVYEARKRQKPLLLQVFEDADPEEIFYSVAWTFNADGKGEWWVCAGGSKGVLRVLNVQKSCVQNSLIGHGEAINDVKVHPRDSSCVITASKDESLRLWNLRTGSTVAVFAGLKGHRGEVVHVDFNRSGSRFASCGIDNSVRIWDVDEDEKVVSAIVESHKAADLGVVDTYVYTDETGQRKRTMVPIRQFPSFVTRKVHKHYVDCVKWVGDLLLSKSVHNRIFLWEPGADRESLASPSSDYTLLEEYVLDLCNVWFIRFAMDRTRRLVACGNAHGVVSVFKLEDIPSKPLCVICPKDRDKARYSSAYVRQCAFSEAGDILLAVDDCSCLVQYERV